MPAHELTAAQVRLLAEALHTESAGKAAGADEPPKFPKSYLERFVRAQRERRRDG